MLPDGYDDRMVMPKPQKYRDVARFLRSNGWLIARHSNGSHEIWTHRDGRSEPIVIARHRDVSAGQIGQIIKKLPHETTPPNWR